MMPRMVRTLGVKTPAKVPRVRRGGTETTFLATVLSSRGGPEIVPNRVPQEGGPSMPGGGAPLVARRWLEHMSCLNASETYLHSACRSRQPVLPGGFGRRPLKGLLVDRGEVVDATVRKLASVRPVFRLGGCRIGLEQALVRGEHPLRTLTSRSLALPGRIRWAHEPAVVGSSSSPRRR